MAQYLFMDTETRSDVKISQGVHRYVEGEHFEVMLVSWAIDDEPAKLWSPVEGEPIPKRLKRAVHNPDVKIVFHNSSFDRAVINKSNIFDMVLTPDRIHDTMVQAYAHALPGSLGQLGEVFGLGKDLAKDKDGMALIRLFCMPDMRSKEMRFNSAADFPKEWHEFGVYAKQDIEAMRAIFKRLPVINYPALEQHIWELDQKINDRGLPVDVELAEAAVATAERERRRLNNQTAKLTDDAVQAATQRDKLIEHIAKEHDVWLPDLRSATLERRLLDDSLPLPLRELIELRLESSRNSASKYRRLLQHQVNGRLHNTLQMYGASRTGRDAGRVFQPQNLMRPTLWRGLKGKELEQTIQMDIESIKNGSVAFLNDNVMELLGNCVRSVIAAPKGRKLCVADLSNIEGRGLVWLASERWKLQYFEDFDAGKIQFDNYVMAYSKAMNISPELVDNEGRDIGKVMELGLGYGGGVAAFITFANVYRMDITELATQVWRTGDHPQLVECEAKHEWAAENGYHANLPKFEFAACEYLKQLWRASHPNTVVFWRDLEEAFKMATVYDRKSFRVGNHLVFRRQGQWLYVRLPSGRCLVYLQPRVVDGQCTFVGMDPYTRQFTRVKTYSGRLAENVTSAAARDIMMHRMPDIEEHGYEIILRVHDEIVAEVPDTDAHSGDDLARLMAKPHAWSKGLPLAAQGGDMHIYHKT